MSDSSYIATTSFEKIIGRAELLRLSLTSKIKSCSLITSSLFSAKNHNNFCQTRPLSFLSLHLCPYKEMWTRIAETRSLHFKDSLSVSILDRKPRIEYSQAILLHVSNNSAWRWLYFNRIRQTAAAAAIAHHTTTIGGDIIWALQSNHLHTIILGMCVHSGVSLSECNTMSISLPVWQTSPAFPKSLPLSERP